MEIRSALERALTSIELSEADQAAVALAQVYAEAIDLGTEDLSKVGPKLLDCLSALLMTPRARAAVVKGPEAEPEENPLDTLRARRRQRAGA